MTKLNTKCSVIGANGYLGRHLTFFLFEKGFDVFAYDIEDTKHQNIPNKIIYSKIDITNQLDIVKINFNVDFIFLFAGITGTLNGFKNYEQYIQINEIGLLNILNGIKESGFLPHCIFPSTRLVYKGSSLPLKETDEKEGKTIYAINKISGEYILQSYSNSFNISYTIFRICVPYGNQFDDNFSFGTIGNFIKKAKNKEDLILYGDGLQKRTFTHITSLCNQIIESLNNSKTINDIYNIAGETYTLQEAAHIIAEQYNVEIRYMPWPNADLKIESGDTVFDASKILSIISNYNAISLKDWIKSL